MRKFYLQANDQQDLVDWINVLNNATKITVSITLTYARCSSFQVHRNVNERRTDNCGLILTWFGLCLVEEQQETWVLLTVCHIFQRLLVNKETYLFKILWGSKSQTRDPCNQEVSGFSEAFVYLIKNLAPLFFEII